ESRRCSCRLGPAPTYRRCSPKSRQGRLLLRARTQQLSLSFVPCAFASLKSLKVERARLAGFKTGVQRVLQRLDLCFVFFQEPQPCPDHIACRAIAPALNLGFNKAGEVLPEGYGCVSHVFSPYGSTILYYLLVNRSVFAAAFAGCNTSM